MQGPFVCPEGFARSSVVVVVMPAAAALLVVFFSHQRNRQAGTQEFGVVGRHLAATAVREGEERAAAVVQVMRVSELIGSIRYTFLKGAGLGVVAVQHTDKARVAWQWLKTARSSRPPVSAA